jgi:hypothetical protein
MDLKQDFLVLCRFRVFPVIRGLVFLFGGVRGKHLRSRNHETHEKEHEIRVKRISRTTNLLRVLELVKTAY